MEENTPRIEINEEAFKECMLRAQEMMKDFGISPDPEFAVKFEAEFRNIVNDFNVNPEKMQKLLEMTKELAKEIK